jgi:hypothetical protein
MMSPQLQTATSQEQQSTAQQQKSQVGRNPTFGVFNGTVDYGPAGRVQYENYCPAWAALSVFETTMDCIDKDRETGKTGTGRPLTSSNVANQIREIASRMPKKWKDRGILYKIANVIGGPMPTDMVVDVPVGMVAPVPGETTQAGGAIQPQEAHGPGVTQDQLNWAFAQINEGISDNASPQLRAAFQLLQLGLQAPPAERTAGRRQRGKQKHQYS